MRVAIMLMVLGLIGLAGCGRSGNETGIPQNALPPDQSGEAEKKTPKEGGEKIKPLK